MTDRFIILLVVLPMLTGIATLLLTGRPRGQWIAGLIGLAGSVGMAIGLFATIFAGADAPRILVAQMGDWPAPFGIALVADALAALMVLSVSVVALAVYVYCIGRLPLRLQTGYFHPLFHFLILGVQWSLLTGDLFNLFVGFEIMLMASYALLVIGTSVAQMRQAYKYVVLNLIGSMLFVTCCGLIYGLAGTLNMADLARLSHAGLLPPAAAPVAALLLIAFGLKTAIFPLWWWLPDTYHTLPAAIGGLFAGLLTKVGAYVMLRTFVMIFGPAALPIGQALVPVLLVSAGVTMLLGVLGAVSMGTVRQILSVHIVSQVGYMVLGIGLMTELAIAGAIFFILHNMIVKTALFLCAGAMQDLAGSDDLKQMGGLLVRAPWLATLFFVAALSLAGLPPLSGFFGKWVLLREAFATGHYLLAAVGLITSLLTLLSMLKIWSFAFWSSPARTDHPVATRGRSNATAIGSIALLVLISLSMGLMAPTYLRWCKAAAHGVVIPDAYVQAVLPTMAPVVEGAP